MSELNLKSVHASWRPIIIEALNQVDPAYLTQLTHNDTWLPGKEMIFNAFSLPLQETHYILFGESPYPRRQSANGYAFWDNAVTDIWSPQGLSKPVNRATSLRNFIKMLLLTHECLSAEDLSQSAISALPKTSFIQTANDLFNNMLGHGVLLLNASLVLSDNPVKIDAKAWQPFMRHLLTAIHRQNPAIQLILLGKIAEVIPVICPQLQANSFVAEHPYNLSFITNPDVQHFFRPFNLIFRA